MHSDCASAKHNTKRSQNHCNQGRLGGRRGPAFAISEKQTYLLQSFEHEQELRTEFIVIKREESVDLWTTFVVLLDNTLFSL